MKQQLRVAVIGASGYTGGELLRLLSLHPQVKIGQVVASSQSEGLSVSSLLPNLAHIIDCQLSPLDIPTLAREVDLVFLALPNTKSLQPVADFISHKKLVIDLSADYRLQNPKVYEQWYQTTHPYPDLLQEQSVADQHQGDGGTRSAIVPVAPVQHAVPGDELPEAVFTGPSLAVEKRVGTEQAVVVQRLHHRAGLGARRVVDRRREQRKRVVEVDHVGALLPDQTPHAVIALAVPDGPDRQPNAAELLDAVVVHRVPHHVVAVGLQQCGLGEEDVIFAALLLVVVVTEQEFHRPPPNIPGLIS